MANYDFTTGLDGRQSLPLELQRITLLPRQGPPPSPHLAVSPDPGPVLTDAPARVGGQPGAWQAPLLIRRLPVPSWLGVSEAMGADVLHSTFANLTPVYVNQVAATPDLTPGGVREQMGGYPLISVPTPSTDIATAVDISAYDSLGAIAQTWPAVAVDPLTPIAVTGDAGSSPGAAYALGALPTGGIEVTGGSIASGSDWDYYSFSVATTGPVQVYFECPAGGVSLDVRDAAGYSKGGPYSAGQTALTPDLTAGQTYYLMLYGSAATYTIRVLPVLQPAYYYRFTTTQPGRFLRMVASCSDPAAAIQLGIRDLAGSSPRLLSGTGSVDSNNPDIGQQLYYTSYPAGDWYIFTRLFSSGGGTLQLLGTFMPFPGKYSTEPWNWGTQPDGGSLTWAGECTSSIGGYSTEYGWFRFRTGAAGTRTFSARVTDVVNDWLPGYCGWRLGLYDINATGLATNRSYDFTYHLAADTEYLLYFSLDWSYAYARAKCNLTVTIS